jgi:hypothetical protein
MNATELVPINGVDVPVIQYRGKRVITLSQMDAVHGRPEGTAGRNFREHRAKLIQTEDYFIVSAADEIRALADEIRRPNPDADRRGGSQHRLTLLTESGYLLLVKAFTDDLAWKVQRQLVSSYFRSPERSSVDLTPWLCFDPRPWEKRFPAEFYIQVLRLKRRELDSDKRTERWWGHITNDVIYFRLGEGVAEGLQKANPIREDRNYRHDKHHQHIAPGAPDRRLTSLIGEAIGVMKMCEDWDQFHAQWDRLHPRFDNLQPQFAFMYSDVRLLLPCKF